MNTISSLLKNLRNRTPVGTIQMYGGSSAPTDWLICDGRAISRSTYASLFAIIGTTYGGGNGSTTFNLPDMRDRVPVGAGSSYNLNASGGATSRSITPAGTIGGTKLSDAQIAHGHGFTQPTVPAHTHGLTAPAVPAHTHELTAPIVPAHTHELTQPTVPKHGHGFTAPTVNNTGPISIASSGGHTHTVYTKYDSEFAEGNKNAYWPDGKGGTNTSMAYINSNTGKHTHEVPAHKHTLSGGAVADKTAFETTGGAVQEKAAFSTTGGAVQQKGTFATTGGAVQEKAAFNTTGGSVTNLSGASSSRTTHTHTWTGSATSVDIRQPYRGINFIIYAGK